MKEYYALQALYKKILSYSLWSRVKKDRNNFRLDLSEDEIRMLIDLIDKKLEEMTNEKDDI